MISIGCDHGGYELKKVLLAFLENEGYTYKDCGSFDEKSVDYPDIAKLVCEDVSSGTAKFGILVCGTGLGMSIAANRHTEIRAALCTTELHARMSRCHNNANVLCLGARVTGVELALAIVETFLATPFEGGRHQRRLDLLSVRA